ncbi:LPXTG cell wall anchor domain-containing protein [Nocardiopsis sp. CA-288880]|uniref:LPXTG cell wall anchor domain-containing protein n=1 Tax=Nocardiopsis sp. CA-288880 TaxID=3239995 RepID=UPI003D950BE7
MQAAVSPRPGHGRRRGLVPPLAATAVAAVLSTTVPAAALAEPVPSQDGEHGHPRVTTVDRTGGLDPEGDTVTVSGIGHAPGSLVEVATWAVPAGSADTRSADDGAVPDDGNAVTVEVGTRGTFTVALDTGAGFAAVAGLDAEEDPFEIRLLELAPAGDAGAAAGGTRAPDPARDTGGDTGEDASGDTGGSAPTASPGAGTGVSEAVPAAPSAPVVVGRVPVAFAATAAVPETAPGTLPRAEPRARPAAPRAPAPREPGTPALTVSRTSGLAPDGETVTVTGTGYDTSKGVYVALCDTSSAGPAQAPGPCIGGVDMDGSGGASVWVSSNPPPYGEGLTTPYTGSGADGGFSVQLEVRAGDENTDCTASGTECAVVTRNDHTRSSDRSQDVFVPVSFGSGSGSGDGGSGSGGQAGNSGGGEAGTSGGGGDGDGGNGSPGRLPRTGAGLHGLVLAASVAALAGAAALFATRRRRGNGTATDPAAG